MYSPGSTSHVIIRVRGVSKSVLISFGNLLKQGCVRRRCNIPLPYTCVKLLSTKQDAKRSRKDGSIWVVSQNEASNEDKEEEEDKSSGISCL